MSQSLQDESTMISPDELVKIIKRDGFVKEQLAARVAALVRENFELLAIIHEAREEMNVMSREEHAGNGEVPVEEPVG